MKKGIIALDIDGTITAEHHCLPAKVAVALRFLAEDGWQLIFITGRTFGWGYRVLKDLSFKYTFAVQNGAIVLEMPERRVISQKTLDHSIIAAMDEITASLPTDYVIYSGFLNGDKCFYRPDRFSDELLTYVTKRSEVLNEKWIPVDSFEKLPIDAFASIKCFGNYPAAQLLTKEIENRLNLHVPIISDPFDNSYFVAQATHPGACKGFALKSYIAMNPDLHPVIAAGDDLNDVSMLEVADIKIVMSTAPKEILQMADIIALPAKDEGIIKGLQDAIKLFEEKTCTG